MRRTVRITENGRTGSVRYSEGPRSIDGYWEFGGRDVIAIVSMGSLDAWQRSHAWAVAGRADVLRHVADEVIRQRAPTCTAEIDELRGDILLRPSAATSVAATFSSATSSSGASAAGVSAAAAAVLPASSTRGRGDVAFVRRLGELKFMLGVVALAITLVLGAVAWLGKSMLTVAPASGVPLGDAVRTATHVVSLIQTTDAHLPRWSGRGGDDTTSISVLLIPLDGGAPQHVQVVGGLTPNAYSLARIMGSDGHTVWLDVAGVFGVRTSDYTRVTVDDLRAANPGLDPSWWDDQRGMDIVEGRLHVMRPDRSAALDVDPVTLKATPATPRPSSNRFHRTSPDELMAAGFVTPGGKWLGLHAPSELERNFGRGEWVRPVERADAAKQQRRLFIGELEPSSDGAHFRLRSIVPVGDAAYLEAAFLRLTPSSAPLAQTSPDGVLMVFTGANGTLVVSRVDMQGRPQWQADTGLDRFRLQQVLPGEKTSAFVGVVPAVPDKLPEPRVVLVDNATGALATHTLWR